MKSLTSRTNTDVMKGTEMPYIQILAKSKKEKGDLFEEFMEKVLDSAGYEDFRRGVRKTGREIDIYAKNKVFGHPIICECKAHKVPIGAGDVHKFYGIFEKEYQKNNKVVGLFFSLSGFKSTAKAAYEEISPDVKNRFLLCDGSFIVSMLRKTRYIASDDKLEHIIKSKIKNSLGEKYLVYTRTGIYWIQLILTENKITHYIILGPKGEEVPAYICSEIGETDPKLRDLKLLDIHAMKKTLISLLKSSKTQEAISMDTNECPETVMLALQNLISQNIVVFGKNHTYKLADELTTFIDLARQFLGSEDELEFFLSQYSEKMLNERLIKYIEQRFRLELDSQREKILLKLLRISPSALSEVLFKSAEKYRTMDEHLKELNMPEQKRREMKKPQFQAFIGSLLRRLIADLDKTSSKHILTKRGITGFRTQIMAVLGGKDMQYMSVESEAVIMILPSTGKIEAGQLVSVTNYDLFIDIAMVLANLGKPEEAINNFDIAIKHVSDLNKLKVAFNNKGLVLASLERYDEAIEDCYNRAIEIDNKLKEPWYNKGLAYYMKGEYKKAVECHSKALQIDPEYLNAQLAKEKASRASEKK